MTMAILTLQLHPSFSCSPLKIQLSPLIHPLKLTPCIRRPVFSSAAVTGSAEDGVAVNGTPPRYSLEEDSAQLPQRLQRDLMPNHVAVIMDGNRRWARMRGLRIGSGYEAGLRSLRRMVELCCRWGIKVLTVFAFSSDNWFRPKVETDFLMRLFERGLRDELEHFERENIRISLIGDPSRLPKPLQLLLADAVETTWNNSRLHLVVAVNYSGQNDLVQACKKIALKVQDGLVEPEDIDAFSIEKELETTIADSPNPDLLIRTSGELRVSNFILWQLAYTELYFSNSLWPDFGEEEFLEALCSFQKRQRRYGRNL